MKNRKQNSDAEQTVSLKLVAFVILIVPILLYSSYSHAQTFTKAIVYSMRQRNMISFTVSHEANVRCYNIEAANDTLQFTAIAKIKSSGNTVIPREYRYDITGHNYKYYRVAEVQMNWQNEYSAIISKEAVPKKIPTEHMPASSQIVTARNTH